MNVWLCPVKPSSLRLVKKRKLFGVPKRAFNTFSLVKLNDLLLFHVLKKADSGIDCVGKVVSEVFEDYEDIWGTNRYPFRVRIEIITNSFNIGEQRIPLTALFKGTNNDELIIEPYLRNIWITQVSNEQYERVKKLFKSK